jgi:hypothetical protein
MRASIVRAGLRLGTGILAATVPAAALAQPAPAEAADIAACLCLHRGLGALGAEMAARRQAYDAAQSRLNGLDARLARERATMNVDDPQAVARFRALLAERDAAFRRSSGALAGALATAVAHYNASVGQYNARCAARPRDPILLRQVEATLSCPAP